MKAIVEKRTGLAHLREACGMTLRPGMTSNASLFKLYRCEHSPIRTQRFWVVLERIATFVSVHLVRHKVGVEHFVQSNRDDRGGAEVVTRDTPVNHGMDINAGALIQMSRRRLCYKSHGRTVQAWRAVRERVDEVDPDLAMFMVPECVYRGFCPEVRECQKGAVAVIEDYSKGNPAYEFRLKQLDALRP